VTGAEAPAVTTLGIREGCAVVKPEIALERKEKSRSGRILH